jgi:hypothetical protein
VIKIKDLESLKKMESKKPIIILFSNKTTTPLLLKSIALENVDNFSFTLINEESLIKEFSVEKLPQVSIIKAKSGEEEGNIFDRKKNYEGRLNKVELQSFLNKEKVKVVKEEVKVVKVEVKPELLNINNYKQNCDKLCLIGKIKY